MAKLKLPFELEKPSPNEYVTQASQIGCNGGSNVQVELDMLDEKSEELSAIVNGGISESVIEVEKVEGETIFVGKYVNTSAEYASNPISVEGYATMLIPCQKGDTFLINAPATPASTAVKLYVVTDDTRLILSSSGTDIPSSRETPIEVTINDESAAFLIVNFVATYDAESDKVSKRVTIESEGLEKRVERLETSTETKIFEGKTIVLFGDSINEFGEEGDNVHGWSKRWCDYFEEMTGANVINIAIGGTCIKQRRSPLKTGGGEDATDMYARLDVINMVRACCGNMQWSLLEEAALYLKNNAYDDNTGIVALAKSIEWDKVDAVLIAAGTNDWAFNSNPYDNIPERNTFDAFEITVENLLTAHPSVKLYYISPYVRYYSTGGESALDMRIAERWSDNYTFGSSGNLKDFNQKLIEKAASMKIPYCDMYNTLGWNEYNFANYFRDTDNTHPFKGFNVIAKKIFAFLRSNQTF